jgi:hypothetical protein
VHDAGKTAVERDALYNELKTYPQEAAATGGGVNT